MDAQTDKSKKYLDKGITCYYDRSGEPKYDEALLNFNIAAKLSPLWDSANYWKAKLLYFFDQYDSALIYINKAILINPINNEFYNLRAKIFDNLGGLDKANKDNETALKLAPNNSENYITREDLIISQYQYNPELNLDSLRRLALLEYDKAIAIDPKNKYYYFNRGQLKEELKDRNGACEDWKKSGELGFKTGNMLYLKYCPN
jgi:tetratricopeptide (TPR) repeat protein